MHDWLQGYLSVPAAPVNRAFFGIDLACILVLVSGEVRTSWSKALVRHGADPGLVLARVLEVAVVGGGPSVLSVAALCD